MIPTFAQSFSYRINRRSQSYHAGDHRGVQGGVGLEFRDNVPLAEYPDARRIAISQSIQDPGEQVYVRVFNQKNPASVYAVCDLSGSMRFAGTLSKTALAAEIAASIAYSASLANDRFAFLGFDKTVRNDWAVPLSRKMHEAFNLIQKLHAYQPPQANAQGLLDVGRYLGKSRGLVFLISDFHLPLPTIEQALNSLSRHQIVPIVLWDSGEYRRLPAFGLGDIVDPETGEQRTLFFRPDLRRKFESLFQARREQLKTLFMRYEMPPFFVEDSFAAAALAKYFYQFSTL
jgi:uncharacterized protein (DUF58 family)